MKKKCLILMYILMFPILHLLLFPLKLVLFLRNIIIKNKNIMIIHTSTHLGHIVYDVQCWNLIKQNCILLVHETMFMMIKTMLNNENIKLFKYNDFSIYKMIQYRIHTILFPPLSESKISKYTLLFMPFLIYTSPFHYKMVSSKARFMNFISSIIVCIVTFSMVRTPKLFDGWNSNVSLDVYHTYIYIFKNLEKVNSPKLYRNIIKVPYIIVNIKGKDNARVLPYDILCHQLSQISVPIECIIFIGVGNNTQKCTKEYIKRLKLNESIKYKMTLVNLVNKTPLSKVVYLLKNSINVISVETGITHMAYVLNVQVSVYLMVRQQNLNINSIYWKYDLHWWHTNTSRKYVIINSELISH